MLLTMTTMMNTFVFVCIIFVTNASSVLTDVKSNSSKFVYNSGNTNCTDVLRQLLNQETLIRMSLSKDVHTLLNGVRDLKDKQRETEIKVTDLKKEIDGLQKQNQQLKQENQEGDREITRLKKQFASITNKLTQVNKTFQETGDSILRFKENQKTFEVQVQQRLKTYESNSSEVLKDLKTELRYMSVTLLNLNKQTLDVNKGIPQLVTSTFRSFSEPLNKSMEELALNLAITQTKQTRLVSAMTDLKGIQSNISKMTTDSISQIKKDIHQQHDTQLVQTAKLATLEFKVNISSNMQTLQTKVGFSVGLSKSSYTSGPGGVVIVFPKIIYEIGGGYNTGTGKFTAPSSGTYVFFCTIATNSAKFFYGHVMLNGISKVRLWSNPGSGGHYYASSNMMISHLNKGDTVWIQRYGGNGIYSESSPGSTFSGFKL